MAKYTYFNHIYIKASKHSKHTYFHHIYIKASKHSKHVIMTCLRHFNHKEQVRDEYDIITTLNQNDKYG